MCSVPPHETETPYEVEVFRILFHPFHQTWAEPLFLICRLDLLAAFRAASQPQSDQVATHNIAMIVLDTLRLDVAQESLAAGQTPVIAEQLNKGWTHAHTPGAFTYAAHQAFFAGFLPTPASPGPHERLFAARFAGSETTTGNTCCFEEPDIVSGLAVRGYHTLCVGGVGFFNKQTKLGCVLPGHFAESLWRPEFGVTDPDSTGKQVAFLQERLATFDQRLFLYLNVSAPHQPNYFYAQESGPDSIASHASALAYADSQLNGLFAALSALDDTFVILCSDHGTAYGEDGFVGHRNSHPSVMNVPYGHFILPAQRG